MPAQACIVITNYNYARFVGAAIDSALAQTVPCEVVVVDDGSTDNSYDAISAYSDRIKFVAKANGGQASAFNSGFVAADADVVFFLDGDDRLDPAAVSSVLDAFEKEPTAARVQFRLGWIDDADQPIEGSFPEADRALPAGDLTAQMKINPDDIAWQPTTGNAFRSRVLDELLPMPTEPYRISADHYLSNLSALYGPVLAIEEPLGRYRVHGHNADHTAGFDVERARDILTRTMVTRRAVIEHGGRRGFAMPKDPDGFVSLSHAGLRLASFRSSPAADHPFAGDSRWRLAKRGLQASSARADLTAARRLMAAAWILALAACPQGWVPKVAGLGLKR